MIYATLIRVNKKDEDADILEPKDGSKTVRDLITLGSDASISMTLNATVKPLKTLTFPNKVALAHHVSKTLNSLSTSKYAVLRHNDSDISKYRDIEFIQILDGRFRATLIDNPFWRHATPPKRRKSTPFKDFDVTLSAQSQLFAMLEGNNADNLLKAQFGINDYQQDSTYQWEDSVLKGGNSIPLREIIRLSRNVLAEPRLPPIGIFIKPGLSSSSFTLSSKGGKALTIDNKAGKDDNNRSLREMIQTPNKHTYESMEVGLSEPFKLSISQMSLHFAAEWALSPSVVIHELCHYITFCLPSPYLLNRGPIQVSWDEYQTLFAGHGAVWSGIYYRGLIDHAYYNEEELYASAQEHGLQFIKTPTLKISDINDAITKFLEKKQEEA